MNSNRTSSITGQALEQLQIYECMVVRLPIAILNKFVLQNESAIILFYHCCHKNSLLNKNKHLYVCKSSIQSDYVNSIKYIAFLHVSICDKQLGLNVVFVIITYNKVSIFKPFPINT